MIRVALRGLLGRKLRAILTALAIILGVAMMSGTYVLTDTIDKAFSTIFDESYAGTDVVVSGKGADISFQGTDAETPPIDESLVAKVRALPDVEAAAGSVADETNTKIIGSDGKAINTQGAPSLGFGIETGQDVDRFNPLNLVEGNWAHGDDEVVIDAGTADRENYKIGDTIQISTLQPKQDFTLTGIAKFGNVDSLGTATFAIFDLPTAQRLLDREGQVDSISVAGTQGTTPEQLIKDIQPILPADAQVRSAAAEAQDDKDDISEFTNFIEYFLLAFAGIALFVGAFVIFNTLSITVAQRTREFATMRTVGASRRQILWSVIVEALTIGIIASVIGLFAGFALAVGLNALFKALDLDLPTANMVFATRTIVVSLLVGTIITLIAGLFPAIRATRVPPIAAVREGFTLPRSRFAPFVPYIALAVIALAAFLLGWSMFQDDLDTATRLLSIAGGVILLFVGVAMISSRTVRPLAVGDEPDCEVGARRCLGRLLPVRALLLGPEVRPARKGRSAREEGRRPGRHAPARRDPPLPGFLRHVRRSRRGTHRAPRRQPRHRRPSVARAPQRRVARRASEHPSGQVRRCARARKLTAKHRPDGRYGRGPHDRDRARHLRRRARQRHEGVEPRRDRRPGEGGLRRHRPGRLHAVRRGRRRRAGPLAGRTRSCPTFAPIWARSATPRPT